MKRAGHWGNGASPRFLLRVDDFPRWDRGPEGFRAFHAILKGAGVHYLLGVIPRPAEDPQDASGERERIWSTEEAAVLAEVAPDVEIALHGWTHRRRPGSAPAEIVGCTSEELDHNLQEGLAVLHTAGFTTHAYIPPFNAVDRQALTILARKFDLVCGGPESVRWFGYLPGPCRLEGVWFLPSYPPAYGRAAEVADFVRAVRSSDVPILIPLTLHWRWEEADKFDGVRRLADALAGVTVSCSSWVQGRAWMP